VYNLDFSFQPKLFSKAEDNIYLVGTPSVWLVNVTVLIAFVFIYLFTMIVDARLALKLTFSKSLNATYTAFDQRRTFCKWLFIGWLTHYVPFFFMSRILFFHHYFPAHIFACMLSGLMLDILFAEVANFMESYVTIISASYFYVIFFSLFLMVIACNFHLSFPLYNLTNIL